MEGGREGKRLIEITVSSDRTPALLRSLYTAAFSTSAALRVKRRQGIGASWSCKRFIVRRRRRPPVISMSALLNLTSTSLSYAVINGAANAVDWLRKKSCSLRIVTNCKERRSRRLNRTAEGRLFVHLSLFLSHSALAAYESDPLPLASSAVSSCNTLAGRLAGAVVSAAVLTRCGDCLLCLSHCHSCASHCSVTVVTCPTLSCRSHRCLSSFLTT